MEVSFAQQTDVGRVRNNNEDALFVDADLGLYIVCDGMGGHAFGEVASSTACEVLAQEVHWGESQRREFTSSGHPEALEVLRKLVRNAVQNAGKAIYKKSLKDPSMGGMGTTVSMIWLVGRGRAIIAHVGDSRVYLMRKGALHQITQDHSFVNDLVRRGAITPTQAQNHPNGNVLSRALGIDPATVADTLVVEVEDGDTWMLCSDGVYNYFPDNNEILRVLSADDVEAATDTLVARALDRGGRDNATAIVLRIVDEPPDLSLDARLRAIEMASMFKALDYTELMEVVALTEMRVYDTGDWIARAGEADEIMHIICQGKVSLRQGEKTLGEMGPGGVIGERMLIDAVAHGESVRAETAVHAITLQRRHFIALIRRKPVLASKLLWSFVQLLDAKEPRLRAQGERPYDDAMHLTDEALIFDDRSTE